MTEVETTEASRSTGKSVLTYVALAAVAVLSVIVYLWLSFSLPKEIAVEAEPEKPWALSLTAALPLEESDLAAIRALEGVERVEPADGETLYIWTSADALSTVEDALSALADEREAARAEKLLSEAEPPEPDPAALAALEAERAELDERAKLLAERRKELDAEADALLEWKSALDSVRTGLNQDGYILDNAEAEFELSGKAVSGEDMRRYSQERDNWYADGEDYLDKLTAYEQAHAKYYQAEGAYEDALAELEDAYWQLEERRKALERLEPEHPQIEDCTWRFTRNPAPAESVTALADAAEETARFSPLRLALQMLFLAVAALSGWLFFARLLSAAAGKIKEPRPGTEETAEGSDASSKENDTTATAK